MQNFIDRLEEVRNLNLPKDQYVLWGSAPLAIKGLRKARDIDIVVTQSLWDDLLKVYNSQGEKKNVIKLGDIEIWNDLLNLTDKIDEIVSNSDMIMELPFMKLSYVIEWKKMRGKEKDLKDIDLINNYLNQEVVIKKNNAMKIVNGSSCTAYEYSFDEKDINIALIEINGRYPDIGLSLNQIVKEMIYVISGKGKIVIENKEYEIEEGDSVLILPNKKYFIDGSLKLLVSCSPAWDVSQYKIIK
ncbi:MAG: hypothetical protein JXA99_11775 [Candidatus Lokiarchaeota archaeon]|nr:hypothetical protein [Candidatus Lokiarchaeota archaeon]